MLYNHLFHSMLCCKVVFVPKKTSWCMSLRNVLTYVYVSWMSLVCMSSVSRVYIHRLYAALCVYFFVCILICVFRSVCMPPCVCPLCMSLGPVGDEMLGGMTCPVGDDMYGGMRCLVG